MSRRIVPLALFVVTLILATKIGAVQGEVQRGLAAYRAADYATAAKLLVPIAADSGYETAIAVATMYRRGVGVPQNYATAYFFAQRALVFKPEAADARDNR